jgi:hypothetical protein
MGCDMYTPSDRDLEIERQVRRWREQGFRVASWLGSTYTNYYICQGTDKAPGCSSVVANPDQHQLHCPASSK